MSDASGTIEVSLVGWSSSPDHWQRKANKPAYDALAGLFGRSPRHLGPVVVTSTSEVIKGDVTTLRAERVGTVVHVAVRRSMPVDVSLASVVYARFRKTDETDPQGSSGWRSIRARIDRMVAEQAPVWVEKQYPARRIGEVFLGAWDAPSMAHTIRENLGEMIVEQALAPSFLSPLLRLATDAAAWSPRQRRRLAVAAVRWASSFGAGIWFADLARLPEDEAYASGVMHVWHEHVRRMEEDFARYQQMRFSRPKSYLRRAQAQRHWERINLARTLLLGTGNIAFEDPPDLTRNTDLSPHVFHLLKHALVRGTTAKAPAAGITPQDARWPDFDDDLMGVSDRGYQRITQSAPVLARYVRRHAMRGPA